LSKVSVDEVFMHYFEKMSSASLGFCHWTPLGDLRFSHPLIAHPYKKSCGHPWDTVYIMLQVIVSDFM